MTHVHPSGGFMSLYSKTNKKKEKNGYDAFRKEKIYIYE